MSNFFQSLIEGHVCLPCRLRLHTHLPLSLSPRPAVSQTRSFSTQLKRSQELGNIDESFTTLQDPFDNPSSFPASRSYEKDDIKLPSDANETKQSTDLGFYIKHPSLYYRRALGVTTLGKPAEVLRLLDAAPKSNEKRWWLMRPQGDDDPTQIEPLTSSDILERVTSERGLVSTARAKENTERLKQEWLSTLKQPDLPPSESDCYELGRRLHDGFTFKQLLNYINESQTAATTDLTDLNKPFSSTLLTRSEWRAGVTPFPGHTAKRLRNLSVNSSKKRELAQGKQYTRSMLARETQGTNTPVKYVLVNRIMRQCWNIRPKEELESVGEVDIRIPEAYLELINSHERNGLHRIAAEFDAKIDISRVESILRITASQATCISTLKLLFLILDEIACHRMSIKEQVNSIFSATNYRTLLHDRLLREVERLSSTVIRWSRPNETHVAKDRPGHLLIYYLKNSGKSFVDAEKILERSLKPTRDLATSVHYDGDQSTLAKLRSVPIEIGRSLPLSDSGVAWVRKCSPTHEKHSGGKNAKPESREFTPKGTLAAIWRQLRMSKAFKRVKSRSDPDSEFWQTNPSRELSASIGRLLYPSENMMSEKSPDDLANKITGHHVFSTEVPGIRRALELREIRVIKVQEQLCVRLNAVGKGTASLTDKKVLPDLEMLFRSQPEDQQAHLESVRLILEEKQADLLLPHEQADLRFATQTYFTMKRKFDPRILKFVESSNLHQWGFNQHDTSKILTIGIPQQILYPKQEVRQENGFEELVDYSVGSIERRSHAYGRPDQGRGERQFQSSLATIDNGPLGGRRQEFRLFEDGALESVPEPAFKGSAIEGLYVSAYRIIEDLRAGTRAEVKHESRKSVKRVRRIAMGFRGKKSQQAILQRRSNIVRRRFTDVPSTPEGFTEAKTRRRTPVRRVQGARYTG